jgi:hypothetical protein
MTKFDIRALFFVGFCSIVTSIGHAAINEAPARVGVTEVVARLGR